MNREGEVWECLIQERVEGLPTDLWLVVRSARRTDRWRHALLNLETGELDATSEWDHTPWPDRDGARRVA